MKKKDLKELYGMMFSDYPDIVTVAQLQRMLGVSRSTVYELIRDGDLAAVKVGYGYKVPKVSVISYVMGGDCRAS